MKPYWTPQWRRIRLYVLDRDGRRCWRCGRPANTVDHIVAAADGGALYDPANLRAACTTCNSADGGRIGAARRQLGRPSRRW